MVPRRSVVIVQRRLTHYRVPFFEFLRNLLTERGITLRLLIGDPDEQELLKHDQGILPWAVHLPTCYFASLCWQPFSKQLAGADLVVVTQENKMLYNHWLLLRPRNFSLAFWGHGANLQSDNPNGFKERFKRWTTNQVDWWFAYTQMSADLVRTAGFPDNRITTVNNAHDTSELQELLQTITQAEINALRQSLGFGKGPVAVFFGSLYSEKRLDFLLKAAEAIHLKVPDFHLLVVGDGPEREKIQEWCNAHPWSCWVGACFGREKAAYISLGQIMLNPGLVGLGILDAFVFGTPLLTTDCKIHSPEIAYLENGINGVMTANDLESYVETSVDLLCDPSALEKLRAGCLKSADEYTIENMAIRFAEGIIKVLSARSRKMY